MVNSSLESYKFVFEESSLCSRLTLHNTSSVRKGRLQIPSNLEEQRRRKGAHLGDRVETLRGSTDSPFSCSPNNPRYLRMKHPENLLLNIQGEGF
jgi:hypothetical protein